MGSYSWSGWCSSKRVQGTFSLGPLIKPMSASRDDRHYALILGIITTGVAVLLFFRPQVGSTTGAVLVGIFVLYAVALIWSLRKGMIAVGFERVLASMESSGS
jgi:hypothetical protein